MPRAVVGVASLLLLGGAAPGPSPDRDPARLQPGLFLYASPGLLEPRFAETVVLLVEHGEGGSMGLVVNRPTDVALGEALEEVEEARGSELPLHWGGPVQPEAILALVRTGRAGLDARPVLPGVHLTGDLADVRAALGHKDPHAVLRVYTGYAGWGSGQLATEVRAGAWVLDVAEADAVFAADPWALWPRVHRLLDRTVAGGLGAR